MTDALGGVDTDDWCNTVYRGETLPDWVAVQSMMLLGRGGGSRGVECRGGVLLNERRAMHELARWRRRTAKRAG